MINGTNTENSDNTENSVSSDNGNVKSSLVTDNLNDLVDHKTDNKNVDGTDKQDIVSYKSHQKLLNQYKTQQARLKEYEQMEAEREEQEQLKKGEYEKLLQSKEERIKNLETEVNTNRQEKVEGKKLMAFMEKLPGTISDNDYLSHIDIDSILIDEETGQIDSLSLEKEVNRFTKKHWRVIDHKNKKGLPSVGHLGGKPNVKRSLKEMSREELRQNYIKGNFK